MSFTKVVPKKNNNMLYGPRAKCGYDWWWHSLTARNKETGEERPFFFEYYICNPALGKKEPIFGQVPGATIENPVKPSYVMVKGGTWLPGGFQLHRFFGWKQDGVKVAKGTPFSVTTPDARFSVGVSVNEKTLRLVAADLRMQEIAYRLLPFDVYACLEGRAPKVAAELEDFLNGYHLDRTRLLGVCVTIPGLVSEEESRVYFAPALGAQDFPLRDLLQHSKTYDYHK